MASLTITALYSKKILFGFSVLLGSLLLLLIVFIFGKNIIQMVFPPEPDPALVAFGKLPELTMPESVIPPKNVTYKIETISGDLKELKTKLKVFAIDISSAPRFGDLNSANGKAQKAKFALPPLNVSDNTATYADMLNKSKTLSIDLITGDILLKSDYLNNTDLITSQVKEEAEIKKSAIVFLTAFGLDPAVYPKEKMTTTRYKIDGGKLTEVASGTPANLIQVNLNRDDLDTIPVVRSVFKSPKITVLASAGGIVSAKAQIVKIQEYRFSTYPLKGIKKAYADLTAGKAIYNKELEGDMFPIRDVSLAYLDTDSAQSFLQPVYVFSADDGLAAYVSAVSEDWIKIKSN